MSLVGEIKKPSKKTILVADCCKLIDDEVADKGGFSGAAVKMGYHAVKGIQPGFIAEVVEKLLPEFAGKIDAIWDEGKKSGDAVGYFVANKSRVADALLSVTDAKAKGAKSAVVRSTYDKLRGSAKKHVEDAVPRLSRLVDKHSVETADTAPGEGPAGDPPTPLDHA
jgi:hypothetical protein